MTPMEAFNNLPPEQQKQVVDLGLKATEKLSNGIFKVLGYKLEAKHMKAMAEAEAYKTKVMADAKAYEIDTIGTAIRNNKDLPVSFNSSDKTLSIDITNPEQLIQRSNYRLQYQQAKKEYNIESVIGKTVLELGDKNSDSTEEVDEDWYTRFFNIVEDISDEQLQRLWARILAGEVLKPRTYTYRFLSVLSNISKNEFEIILKIAPFVSGDIIINDQRQLISKDISYHEIDILEDMGVLKNGSVQIRGLDLDSKQGTVFIEASDYAFVFINNGLSSIHHMIDVIDVTETGKQLFKLANISLDMDYMKNAFINKFSEFKKLSIFAAEITDRKNDQIFVSEKHIFDINPV